MWDPSTIDDVWIRDSFDPASLVSRPNVAEWLGSDPARASVFEELLAAACEDLARWGVEPVGVFPSGVGGLTVAGRRAGVDVVAKWVAELSDASRSVALSEAFSEAGLGPAVLGSSLRGLLLERALPGVPLRCFAPSERNVVGVAAALAGVELPAMSVGLGDPVADGIVSARRALRDGDVDGFAARALSLWGRVAELVEGRPTRTGHGDLQLGNVLTAGSGVVLIDAGGVADPGLLDPARLVAHSTIDAFGAGVPWDVERLLGDVAAVSAVSCVELRVTVAAFAAATALYIRRQVPARGWEWVAADRLAGLLV